MKNNGIDDCETIEQYKDRVTYLESLVMKYKFDYLTKLMMKQDFYEKFNRVFEEYKFANEPFTLVLADINDLHNTNRLYGMHKGDELIISVAKDLRQYFTFNQVFRISGDEFCILLRENIMPHDKVIEYMKKIKNIEFMALKSNGHANPFNMFKEVDNNLTKIKGTKKRL